MGFPANYQQVSIAPANGPLHSASIASLTGASQVIVQASNNPLYILIQNPPGNNNIGINMLGGTAVIGGVDTIVLLGGGTILFNSFVPTNGLTVIGTAAQTVVAVIG